MRIVSYNIHKGVSGFGARRLNILHLRERLHALNADLVFLQEVQGAHHKHHARFEHWPGAAQHDFLASTAQSHAHYHSAYGLNAYYPHGHHGNALLSRFPIRWRINRDISDHRLEQRGLLHCVVECEGRALHAVVIHLGLFHGGRLRQAQQLLSHIEHAVPKDAPLIIAGDFNDWRQGVSPMLESHLGVQEVLQGGRSPLSFPARRPFLPLDRIYQRGFRVLNVDVHHGKEWARLSDHAPLVAELAWA